MKKVLDIFIICSCTFIVVFGAVCFYWLFLDPDIVTINGDPQALPVDKTSYKIGETITYTMDYCATKRSVATVDRAFVDGYRITFTTARSDLPTGCHVVKVNDLSVPSITIIKKDELYYIDITAVRHINPLRDQITHVRTVGFKLEGNPAGIQGIQGETGATGPIGPAGKDK